LASASLKLQRQLPPQRQPPQQSQPPSQPLYARIAADIARNIRAGKPPVGSFLAGETALAQQFHASRHTVRHALDLLEERGLIARRHGSGTCVIARDEPRSFVQSLNSISELLRYPNSTYRKNRIVQIITISSAQVAMLRVPEGSSWLHIGALRCEMERDLPVAWTDIYVAPQYAGIVKRADHEKTMVFEQIEKHYGVVIDRADVEIYADSLRADYAKALRVKTATPSLVIVRRYHDRDGKPFEITVTHHPEKRFVFAMSWNRSAKN
jgi:GntR family transcriptional regulator